MMTDRQYLEWIQNHLSGLIHTMISNPDNPNEFLFHMFYIDDKGVEQSIYGKNIKDCINNIIKKG